jgi:hypothetical protein
VPSLSVMKSRLLKRKAWKGVKTGGSHSPTHEAMGNSNEPKQIVLLRLVSLDVSDTKAIRSPRQWTHDVLSTVGAKLSVPEMAGS